MTASLNKAQIIGNLGSDPEVRSTSSGTCVATLSVATNRSWTDRDGSEQSATEWHRVICWDRLAEVCEEWLGRGDRVYVEGRIQYREWEDDAGRTRYSTEIIAKRLLMLGSPSGRSGGPPREDRRPETVPAGAGGAAEDDHAESLTGGADDDLPF